MSSTVELLLTYNVSTQLSEFVTNCTPPCQMLLLQLLLLSSEHLLWSALQENRVFTITVAFTVILVVCRDFRLSPWFFQRLYSARSIIFDFAPRPWKHLL